MCDICGRDFSTIEYTIEMGNNILKICPNCSVGIAAHKIQLEPGDYISEISGNSGAIKIKNHEREFILTPDEAVRLFGYSLMPDEYCKLIKEHSPDEFELHDDFYDNDGFAFQPYDGDEYVENLKNFLENANISADQRRGLEMQVYFLENPDMMEEMFEIMTLNERKQ